MNTPHPATDAFLLLAGLRRTAEGLLERINGHGGAASPSHESQIRQLLLSLELHHKLEEQFVFPALHDRGLDDADVFVSEDNELTVMRDLAQRVQDGADRPAQRQAALLALESVALLHFGKIERLLARHATQLDRPGFTSDVQAMLARWQEEILRTGDIEDEERDPVGLPPR